MNAAKTLMFMVFVCALVAVEQGIATGQGVIVEPIWFFQTEGLALKRDGGRNQVFAHAVTRTWAGDPAVSSDADTVLLTTNDMGTDFRGGARAVLGRRLGDWYSIEACYFGLRSWGGTATVSERPLLEDPQGTFSPGNLLSPWTDYRTTPDAALDYNDYISISYRSRLENFELNFRRRFIVPPGRIQGSLLVGGRYMNIHETFDYHSFSTPLPPLPPAILPSIANDVSVRTNNQMIGVQVGGLFEFEIEPQWRVDCEIKGGFFQNDADQTTTYTNSIAGVPITRTRSETRSSFALDLRLSLIYQVSPNLSTYLGYQALWVRGLALASENFDQDINTLRFGPPVLVDDGKLVYHGPRLGGTLQW